jgi:hypothetical protein
MALLVALAVGVDIMVLELQGLLVREMLVVMVVVLLVVILVVVAAVQGL